MIYKYKKKTKEWIQPTGVKEQWNTGIKRMVLNFN